MHLDFRHCSFYSNRFQACFSYSFVRPVCLLGLFDEAVNEGKLNGNKAIERVPARLAVVGHGVPAMFGFVAL